jgi:uncharacterized protein (TIGR03790 family)
MRSELPTYKFVRTKQTVHSTRRDLTLRRVLPLDRLLVNLCRVGRLAPIASLFVVSTFLAPQLWAGGGPENVFLIVNVNSDSSKAIANHYVALRKIPAANVFYVDWNGNLELGSGENVRNKILLPALQAIGARGLGGQIDYLIYSSDFPWRLELKPVFPKEQFAAPFGPMGSLTGITYLAPLITGPKPDPIVVQPHVNWYVPAPDQRNAIQCQVIADVPSRGFHFRHYWNPAGEKTNSAHEGQRYFLSTMLGVTQGRGNTVAEVISYLKRAASSDGRRPTGTIYFMWNRDLRSTTRHACYESVAAQINRLGIKARVIQGTLPLAAPDIMGLTTGVQKFDFSSTRSVILPGAICEHLTSSGGVLISNAGQTPLTEFLTYGAAGSSGTVTEPRALQAKFPLPTLHLHYARGCSLAESFYQSVTGPYQLLIVGDPLCQPWAVIPDVKIAELQPGEEIKGTLTISAQASVAGLRRIGTYELFADGKKVAHGAPGKPLTLDTTQLSDGYHELRVVAVNGDAIEAQGRAILPIIINNRGAKLALTVTPQGNVSRNAKLRVSVHQKSADTIVIRQNSRELARVQGETGDVEIDAAQLGEGPTSLQAVSEGNSAAASVPVPIHVQ